MTRSKNCIIIVMKRISKKLKESCKKRPITQLVEFLSYKQAVIGSSPVGPILSLKDSLNLS